MPSNLLSGWDRVDELFPTKGYRNIVGFCGPQGVGKTTLAKALEDELGYTRVAFADQLREDIKHLLDLTDEDVTTHKNEPIEGLGGITPRVLLQRYGTDLIRDRVKPTHWIDVVHDKITRPGNWVVEDIRFSNEATMVRNTGGIVYRIRRMLPNGRGEYKGPDDNHASEKDVIFHDREIVLPTVEPVGPPVPARPGWDTVWFETAETISRRSTCERARVGAVVVDQNNRSLVSGYNGAPAGEDHCIDVGCKVEDNHCIRTVHAEGNALAYAARVGVSVEGATVYVSFANTGSGHTQYMRNDDVHTALSEFPCHTCRGPLMASGVDRVVIKAPSWDGVTEYVR